MATESSRAFRTSSVRRAARETESERATHALDESIGASVPLTGRQVGRRDGQPGGQVAQR